MDMDIESIEIKLKELKEELTKFNKKRALNFFDITLISEREISHSAFLAWLLNPKENHGLNDLFLQSILKKINYTEEYKINEVVVETEITEISRRIDIIIHINDVTICIENKIWDYPTIKQIEDEIKEFEPNYMVLLAPKEIITSFKKENDLKNIYYINYDYICKSIKELMNKTTNDDLKTLLKNYNLNLEENIMTNEHNPFTNKSILYNKYQDFIDEVTEKYNDEKKTIKNSIKKKIQTKFSELNKYGFTTDNDIYVQNKIWYGEGFDIYLVIDLDIDHLNKNKSSISIKMGSYIKEKSQSIRKSFIAKFGNFLEQNGYKKSKDNYSVYEKEFEFENFIEDVFKEVKVLMENNVGDFITDCINNA
ncbi:MAG: PD-(D/E)XK nuclease family protein [Nanoarchaeota archaeon]|nr:PD-(D/E)XK nuclease family protein [Nanoarchaeota archaeon]